MSQCLSLPCEAGVVKISLHISFDSELTRDNCYRACRQNDNAPCESRRVGRRTGASSSGTTGLNLPNGWR